MWIYSICFLIPTHHCVVAELKKIEMNSLGVGYRLIFSKSQYSSSGAESIFFSEDRVPQVQWRRYNFHEEGGVSWTSKS